MNPTALTHWSATAPVWQLVTAGVAVLVALGAAAWFATRVRRFVNKHDPADLHGRGRARCQGLRRYGHLFDKATFRGPARFNKATFRRAHPPMWPDGFAEPAGIVWEPGGPPIPEPGPDSPAGPADPPKVP